MTSNSLFHFGHRAVMGTLRRLPLPAARFGFRAYHKAMRSLAPDHVARTYFGALMHCDPRDLIQRMILYFGVWEPNVSRTIEQNLAAGDVFVDVGANVGYDTLLAATRVGPTGRVVAIEASPRTFALLQSNLALNTFADNVRAVHAAVSDTAGTLDLYEVDAGNIGAATTLATRGGKRSATVDALPLERILSDDERRRLRLIKMDVEGAEPPILRHILDRLHDYPETMDIIVEASPNDDAIAWQAIFERLRGNGFSAWAIENEYGLDWYLKWRHAPPLRRLDEMPSRQQDLLFTRRQQLDRDGT
ncbi:FkbM family methyltransferase [Reyranella sp.]|uniref:FkbM family methyltransferase n=1 Tax=Reyranella sp. TaxID=1929291 RepID=UPI003BA96532